MRTFTKLTELIGNTPLLDVSELLDGGKSRLLLKLELFNPGGSAKDRIALANRWGNSGNSDRVYFLELQNHCRWGLQPWKLKDACSLEEKL